MRKRKPLLALVLVPLALVGLWFSPVGQRWRVARWDDATLVTHAAAHPEDALALMELGTRLKNRGEKAAASQNFLLAAKANPNLPDAWAEAITLSAEAGDLPTALSLTKDALRLHEKNSAVQAAVGCTYELSGDTQNALEHYKAAQNPEIPARAEVEAGLARVALARKNGTAARQAAQRWTELAPNSADAWRTLGQALRLLGELEPARIALEKALKLAEGDPETLTVLGELLAETPDGRAQAEKLLTQAGATVALGRLALQKRDYATAEAQFRRALQQKSEDTEALFGLAQALQLAGKKVEAATVRAQFETLSAYALKRSHLQLRLGRDPQNITLWNELGERAAAQKDTALAKQAWERSLRLKPDQPELTQRLAELR